MFSLVTSSYYKLATTMKPELFSRFCAFLFFLLVAGDCVLTLEQRDGAQWRRNSDNNLSRLPASLDNHFVNSLTQTVEELNTLQSSFLIHTDDSLMFVAQNQTKRSIPFSAILYENLKTISHLPVTAVSLLIPELVENGSLLTSQLSNTTRQALRDFQTFVANVSTILNDSTTMVYSSEEQLTRQNEIVGIVLRFLDDMNNKLINITMNYLKNFTGSLASHLSNNSEDAVRDYLQCLNQTVSSLALSQNVLTKELTVVLSVEPFSRRESFLFQYYSVLLNISSNSERLILLPGNRCSTNYCPNATELAPPPMLYSSSLSQYLNQIFSSEAIHSSLSQAAASVICSDTFSLPSCLLEITETSVEGFHTRLEKSYVVLMISFGGLAVLLGIVLSCILYENRSMASEQRSQENTRSFKLDGPNVFTPLSSLQEEDDSVRHQHSADSSGRETLKRHLLNSSDSFS